MVFVRGSGCPFLSQPSKANDLGISAAGGRVQGAVDSGGVATRNGHRVFGMRAIGSRPTPPRARNFVCTASLVCEQL